MRLQDVRTRSDMQAWIRGVLVERVAGNDLAEFRRNLTLLSFNRVTPGKGTCTESASLFLTMRRVRTVSGNMEALGNRFGKLYPNIWQTASIPAGAGMNDTAEAKDSLNGANGSYWWKHSPYKEGFLREGGYLASMALSSDGEGYVHLLDYSPEGTLNTNASQGACFGIPVSSSLPVAEFWKQGYFDASFSSLAIELMIYNPNLQTMSRIAVTFIANFAGLITDTQLRSESIRLDIYSSTMRYLEACYLIFTFCYLLAFVHDSYKKFPDHFKEPWSWINFASIALSFTSLGLWYSYEPMLTDYISNGNFRDPNEFRKCFLWLEYYKWASAVATLMIYLRLLQFLAKSNPRVMLLARTLTQGAKSMLVYVFYVGVILAGSAAFAQTYFASFSSEFVSLPLAFFHCYNLFFGNTESLKSIDASAAPLKNLFYVPFMVFFYFVSVQMFNAIINYSYNLVSEDMEPQFEQERLERKRKQANGMDNRPQWVKWVWDKIQESMNQDGEKGNAPATTSAQQKPLVTDKDVALNLMEEYLDEEGKQKLETYMGRNDAKKNPDSAFKFFRFVMFAVAYIWFLSVNLSVGDNFQINSAVQSSIESFPTVMPGGDAFVFDEIATLPQAAQWMKDSFPLVIFNTTAEETTRSAVELGIYDKSAVCLKTWNCLFSAVPLDKVNQARGPGGEQAHVKEMVRITQRRAFQKDNEGRKGDKTPERLRFYGELQDGEPVSKILAETRIIAPIDPNEAPSASLENSSALSLAEPLKSFCRVIPEGDSTSYAGHGGLVCIMNADRPTFLSQLELLMTNDFFTPESSAWVIDFAMQNSNRQILSYVTITFKVLTSGEMKVDFTVDSMKLFNFNKWYENISSIVPRIFPGILYMLLTCMFIQSVRTDFRKEKLRHKMGQGATDTKKTWERFTSHIKVAWNFVRLDVFNFLEIVSICVSLFSAGLFVWWTYEDTQLDNVKDKSLADFLSYCVGLVTQARLYNRLSAVNIVMIGVRPLKFARENARFAKMNQTLWDSAVDLRWFVIMLFVTMAGFVMLAFISFGQHVTDCSTFMSTIVFCFRFVLGDFDFTELWAVDRLMSAFMFPYLILMYCVFTNIFFAIIDRHFVSIDPPPTQWFLKLKPIFGRVCRCINWDQDHVMEEDPNAVQKVGPPSRRDHVRKTQAEIRRIKRNAENAGGSTTQSKTRMLSDVAESDEKMEEVMIWGADEAKKIISEFATLSSRKRNASNEEEFVKRDVMDVVKRELKDASDQMLESGRQMRYASRVHEKVALKDQDALARYICKLEKLINKHTTDLRMVEREVKHLKGDHDKMGTETHADAHRDHHHHHHQGRGMLSSGDKDDEGSGQDDASSEKSGSSSRNEDRQPGEVQPGAGPQGPADRAESESSEHDPTAPMPIRDQVQESQLKNHLAAFMPHLH